MHSQLAFLLAVGACSAVCGQGAGGDDQGAFDDTGDAFSGGWGSLPEEVQEHRHLWHDVIHLPRWVRNLMLVAFVLLVIRVLTPELPFIPDAIEFVNDSREEAVGSFVPSGKWSGYYNQYGSRHALCHFCLDFSSGRISGDGQDDVGRYEIAGLYDPRSGCRIAFSKRYERGSLNNCGVHNAKENRGHRVEYRGVRAGPSDGHGFRGTWYLELDSGHCDKGGFHIWPIEMRTSDAGKPVEARVFEISRDDVCAVCLDNAIDACIHPCGHIATCSQCLKELPKLECPMCRSAITSVTGTDGRSVEGILSNGVLKKNL